MAMPRSVQKFRLKEKVGPHSEPNPKFDKNQPESEDNPRDIEFVAGKIVSSDRNLIDLFPGKFELVHPKRKEQEEDDQEEQETPRRDVTEDFASAKDGGLQVFKEASGKFFVFEEGEDSPVSGSEGDGLSKKQVESLLKKLVTKE